MRLYMAGSTQYAVDVIKNGFTTGRPMYDPGIDDSSRTSYMEYCEFRDRRPTRASMVVTPEAVFEDLAETNVFHVTIDGPVFLDDPGDFLLSIEVADDFALHCEVALTLRLVQHSESSGCVPKKPTVTSRHSPSTTPNTAGKCALI